MGDGFKFESYFLLVDGMGLAALACVSGIGQSPRNTGVPRLNINKPFFLQCNMSHILKN